MSAKKTILNEEIEARNFNKGGAVSSRLKTLLTRLGIIPEIIKKASVISYELEMNIIIHSRGGEIKVGVDEKEIKIQARDQGPGIEDVEKALKPGYSTADQDIREMGFGAGMGLNNVQKYSDKLTIDSGVDQPTVVCTKVKLNRED